MINHVLLVNCYQKVLMIVLLPRNISHYHFGVLHCYIINNVRGKSTQKFDL
jgi:hypothetical protein